MRHVIEVHNTELWRAVFSHFDALNDENVSLNVQLDEGDSQPAIRLTHLENTHILTSLYLPKGTQTQAHSSI